MIAALRLPLKAQVDASCAIIRRAPHWRIAGFRDFRSMEGGLCRVIFDAAIAILQERLEETATLNPQKEHDSRKFVVRLGPSAGACAAALELCVPEG
eukprot:4978904-Amphidinium_carterae.1